MNDVREIEEQFRDAARAYAEGVEPAPDAWDRLTRRTRAAQRRGRVIRIGGVSAVAAAAVVVGAFLLADDSKRRVEVPPAGPDTTTPSNPVVLTEIPWNDPIQIGLESGPVNVDHPGTWLFKLVLP